MEKYDFVETIAYGSRTVVYKGRDPENGNEFAMKEYVGQKFSNWDQIMEQMEVYAMRKISNIHIVALKDVVWEEKSQVLYLV